MTTHESQKTEQSAITAAANRMLDALAIGPHPDDIEMCCGGTIAKLVSLGHRIGLVDCTQGELGSRGTVEDRRKEAAKAAELLAIYSRTNLGLPDGAINPYDSEHVKKAVKVIRDSRPKILLIPYWEERHPDHVATSRLFERAVFLAGLKAFEPTLGDAYTVQQVLYYQMRAEFRASFVVDTTKFFEKKMAAIRAFPSQTTPEPEAEKRGVLIAAALTLPALEARDRHCGGTIGVEYGEAFFSRSTIAMDDPVSFFASREHFRPLFFPAL